MKGHSMQTFLPLPDFDDSVRTLDRQRLGKQRVETYQVMQALLGFKIVNATRQIDTGRYRVDEDGALTRVYRTVAVPQVDWIIESYAPKGWMNHPIAIMWRHHLDWLLEYQVSTVTAWTDRGYKDTCLVKTMHIWNHAVNLDSVPVASEAPSWLGDDAFHASHRSNLLRKNPSHYRPLWPDEPDDLPYVWPAG